MQFEPAEAVRHWAIYAPDRIALVLDEREISYSSLNSDVERIAFHIEQNCPDEQRIAVVCSSKYKLLVAILATARLGKSALILHPHNSPDALKHCLREASAHAVIADKGTPAGPNFAEAFAGCLVLDFDRAEVTLPNAQPRLVSPAPTSEWAVFYSSGTTGAPKGIVRDQYSVVVELLGWCFELRLTSETCLFMGRPIFYTGGLILTLSALLIGGTVVLPSQVSWETYQTALRRRPIDLAFFIPSQIREFLSAAASKAPAKSARAILLMGELVTAKEKLEARQVLGSEVIESWGNTEGLGTITRPEDLDNFPESIGRPFLTDLMFVVDHQGGVLRPGQIGRLAGATEAGFSEYCSRPDDTRLAKQNYLLISDDIGYVDEHGMFYVLGRTDEVIDLDGKAILLPELESDFRSLSVVEDACIVCTGDGADRVFVVAIVPTEEGKTKAAEDMLDLLNERCPENVQVSRLQLLAALPRTPTGKVMRHEVARRLSERQ